MLSIAGSDPSGGAGIQADLKTATALGMYGAAALTSLTVQNTRGVTDIHAVPAAFVADQCRAVLADLNVAAIKIGMLADADIAEAVAAVLGEYPVPAVVLDPVMVAASGDRLVAQQTVAVIAEQVAPQSTVVTPNLPEAAELLGSSPPKSPAEMISSARSLRRLGPAVFLKGGHLPQSPGNPDTAAGEDVCRDLLVSPAPTAGATTAHDATVEHPDEEQWFSASRAQTHNTHGTGCTLSTALAVGLAGGHALPDAVAAAKDYVTGALRAGATQRIGSGSGPVDHLWREHEAAGPQGHEISNSASPLRPPAD